MKYYLGIDIGKRIHVAALTDEDGVLLGKPLSFGATTDGFSKLLLHIDNLIGQEKREFVHVGFEATGHYWFTLYAKLKELSVPVSVLNPLEVKAFRNEGIRGNKTDSIDAVKIAKLLRFGDYHEAHVPTEDMVSLRQLTRFRADLMSMATTLKLKANTTLDVVFPEYADMFSDTFNTTSLALLKRAKTPEKIAAIPVDKLIRFMRKISRGRYTKEKVQKLHHLAGNSMGLTIGMDAFSLSLTMLLSWIEQLLSEIKNIDRQIEKYLKKSNTKLTTIPGVGPFVAATVLAEVGDIKRFGGKDGAEKLVAFAGLDPKIRQSGKMKGKTKMSKRGSTYLRYAIRQASLVSVMACKEPMFSKIYEKQKAKGKHMEVALSHVARKMLHVIYSILKSGKKYKPNI